MVARWARLIQSGSLGLLAPTISALSVYLALCLVPCLTLCLTLYASAQTEEMGDSFSRYLNLLDPTSPTIEDPKPGKPTTIRVGFPEDAERFCTTLTAHLQSQKHKFRVTQTGLIFSIDDISSGEKFLIVPERTQKRGNALKTPEVLADLFPNNVGVLFTLSSEYEYRKDWKRALKYYQLAMQRAKRTTVAGRKATAAERRQAGTYIANCAYYELNARDYEAALKHLSEAIELDPMQAANYKNRASLYAKLGKRDLAQQDMAKLAELAKSGKLRTSVIGDRPVELARDRLARGNYEAVFEAVADGLKSSPNPIHLLHYSLQSNLNIGNYRAAVADSEKMYALAKTERIKGLVAAVKQIAAEGPLPYGDLRILEKLPAVPFKRLDGLKVISTPMAPYARTHKGDVRIHDAIAVRLWMAARIKECDNEIDKELRVDPDSLSLLKQKIQTSDALNNAKETDFACTRCIDLIDSDADVVLNLDIVQYIFAMRKRARAQLGLYARAIEDCSMLLKIEPDSAEVYRDRADYAMKLGKYAQAVEDYTQSIKHDDTRTGSNFLLRAKAYEKLNKPDLAAQDLQTAGRLGIEPGKTK